MRNCGEWKREGKADKRVHCGGHCCRQQGVKSSETASQLQSTSQNCLCAGGRLALIFVGQGTVTASVPAHVGTLDFQTPQQASPGSLQLWKSSRARKEGVHWRLQ
jgi:hypothetical protein